MIRQRVGTVAVQDVGVGIDVIPVKVRGRGQRRVGAETRAVRKIGFGEVHVRTQRRIDLSRFAGTFRSQARAQNQRQSGIEAGRGATIPLNSLSDRVGASNVYPFPLRVNTIHPRRHPF